MMWPPKKRKNKDFSVFLFLSTIFSAAAEAVARDDMMAMGHHTRVTGIPS